MRKERSKKSGQARVLQHLREKGRITCRQMALKYGIWHFNGLIYILRKEGWEITAHNDFSNKVYDGPTYILAREQRL